MRRLSGGIRPALAQYRELAAFAQFASDLDEATKAQLEHGQRVTELMKQAQYALMNIAEVGMMLYCANEGYLNDVEVDRILDFEAALLSYALSEQGELIGAVARTGDWNDVMQARFKALEDRFKASRSG